MNRKAAADIIKALLQERREAENEKSQLERRVGNIRRQREELLTEPISGGRETIAEMDEQISRLAQEIREREQKLKNICMAARTICAGD